MIPVLCPHCGRRYRTMTEGMGKTAVCSGCAQAFVIGAARPKFVWKPEDFGMDSWVGVEVSEEVKSEKKDCIICGAPLDPGAIRCSECGANQVTGVVHRKRKEPPAERTSLGSVLPVRWILVLLVMAAIGGAGYWLIIKIGQTVVTTGSELADQRLAAEVAARLDGGADTPAITERYAGRVSDRNFPSFIRMLTASKPSIRQAAVLLIGCGNVRDLKPLLDWAEAGAPGDEAVLEVLDAIGERRLVELSCHAEPDVRRPAALALIRLAGKSRQDAGLLDTLSKQTQLHEKQASYNLLGRPWPEATGVFAMDVDQTRAPFPVSVEQYGRTYYFKIGEREFRSSMRSDRSLTIPIERWCEATGSAVDPEALRQLIAGSVSLSSPTGAGWRGTIRLSLKRAASGPLPGFLPFEPPAVGQMREIPLRLTRP